MWATWWDRTLKLMCGWEPFELINCEIHEIEQWIMDIGQWAMGIHSIHSLNITVSFFDVTGWGKVVATYAAADAQDQLKSCSWQMAGWVPCYWWPCPRWPVARGIWFTNAEFWPPQQDAQYIQLEYRVSNNLVARNSLNFYSSRTCCCTRRPPESMVDLNSKWQAIPEGCANKPLGRCWGDPEP